MTTSDKKFKIGISAQIDEQVCLGYQYRDGCGPTRIGDHARIRYGAILYGDVTTGDHLSVGHYAVVREKTAIGDYVVVGSQTVIEGQVNIGSYVKIESRVFIPTHTQIGSHVFIGPGTLITNDKFPLRQRENYAPKGAIIEDHVSLGAGSVLIPGVRIGYMSLIGAGSVVTRDVPDHSLVVGNPGKIRPLPKSLDEKNRALSWPLSEL